MRFSWKLTTCACCEGHSVKTIDIYDLKSIWKDGAIDAESNGMCEWAI